MNTKKYLERIHFNEEVSIDIVCLRTLHRHHVMRIPFEVLDIHFNKEIKLNLQTLYFKIIQNQRGGYCYELNYLFYNLLVELGFHCSLISCSIYNEEVFGPDFDHMAILVDLEEKWLIDVGYGDLFIEPLKINYAPIQKDVYKNYKIKHLQNDSYLLTESQEHTDSFINKYRFNLRDCNIQEFHNQNHFKQFNQESHFIKNLICTLPIKNGRKTILNNTFKIKIDGITETISIQNKEHLFEILFYEFGFQF